MKTRLVNATTYLVIFGIVLLAGGCGSSQTDLSKSGQVLAKVGDKEITTSYFDRQIANLPESAKQFVTQGQGKKAMLEGMVNREIIFNEAIKKKLDKDAELQRKVEDMKRELLVTTYLQNEVISKIKVDDKDVRDFYDQNPGEFKNREEIRISQIVVADEKKAKEVIEKLSNRRDFGDLAAEISTDKPSAARKGDVGFFTHGRLPQEIRDSVFKLKVGEVSQPHKMNGAYEIYKITDRKTTAYTFEQVKDAIRMQLFNQKMQAEVKRIVDEAKKTTPVVMNDSLLK